MKKKTSGKTVEVPSMKIIKRRDTRQELISVQTMLRIQNLTVEQIKEMENHVVDLRERLKTHVHELNLEEVSSRREFLEKNSGMMDIFKTMWLIFLNDTKDGVLTREGYEKFHHAILVALMGVHSFEDVSDMIENDYHHDHSVFGPLNQVTFFDLLFETIETYTEVMDPTYYAAFAWSLLDAIADTSLIPPRLRPFREIKTITKLTNEASMIKHYLLTKKVRAALAIETEFLSRIPEVQKRLGSRRHGLQVSDGDMLNAFTHSLSLSLDENGAPLGGVFSDSGDEGGADHGGRGDGISLDSHSTLSGDKDKDSIHGHDNNDQRHEIVIDDNIHGDNPVQDNGRRRSTFLEYMNDINNNNNHHHHHHHRKSTHHYHTVGQLSPPSPVAMVVSSSPVRDPNHSKRSDNPLLLPLSDSLDKNSNYSNYGNGGDYPNGSRARFASYLLKGSGLLDRQQQRHEQRNHMQRDRQALGDGGFSLSLGLGLGALNGSPLVMHPRHISGNDSADDMSVLSEGSAGGGGHKTGMVVHKGLYYLDYSNHQDYNGDRLKGPLTMNGQGVTKSPAAAANSNKGKGMPLAQMMAGQFSVTPINHHHSKSERQVMRVVHLPLAAAAATTATTIDTMDHQQDNLQEKDHFYHLHLHINTPHHTNHNHNHNNDDQASVITGQGAIVSLPANADADANADANKIIEPSYATNGNSYHDPLSSQRINALFKAQSTRDYIAARSDRMLVKMTQRQQAEDDIATNHKQPPVDYLKQTSTDSSASASASVNMKGRFGGLLPSKQELQRRSPPRKQQQQPQLQALMTLTIAGSKAPTKDTIHNRMNNRKDKTNKQSSLSQSDSMDDSGLWSAPTGIAFSLHHHRPGSRSPSPSPSSPPPSRSHAVAKDNDDDEKQESQEEHKQHEQLPLEQDQEHEYCLLQEDSNGSGGNASLPLIKPIPLAFRHKRAVPRAIHTVNTAAGLSSSMSLSTTDFPPITVPVAAFTAFTASADHMSSSRKVPWLPRGTLTPLDNPDHSDLVTGWKEKIELLRFFPFDPSRDRMRIKLSNRDSRKAFEQFAAKHHEYYQQQQQQQQQQQASTSKNKSSSYSFVFSNNT